MRRTATEGYEARSVPVAVKMEAGDLWIEVRINHADTEARSRRGGRPLAGPLVIFSCSLPARASVRIPRTYFQGFQVIDWVPVNRATNEATRRRHPIAWSICNGTDDRFILRDGHFIDRLEGNCFVAEAKHPAALMKSCSYKQE